MSDLALVMSGGGARAAYQVGFIRYLADRYPDLTIEIITGVSAGAINAAFIANHTGSFKQKAEELTDLWANLRTDQVFDVAVVPNVLNVLKWGTRLVMGSASRHLKTRSLLDPSPLQEFIGGILGEDGGSLPGIEKNLEANRLKAVAVTGSSYSSGESVNWIQGNDVEEWNREMRVGYKTEITLLHIMASASLPFFFPAVRIGTQWYGDGGMRLTAPLSPAVRLGAKRILAISTRHETEEEILHRREDYPQPAQIAGALFNSIFLDGFEADALRIKRINSLIEELPLERRQQLSLVEVAMLRPSVDLGTLANQYEPQMPKSFRFMERGLGTQQTRSNDVLSLLMFQPDYLSHLIEIGYADAKANDEEICRVVDAG